ncbi:uncharacterized protein BT62DRAFT_1001182 [Guyanagaster necrorhizus]|uniref:Uncharacterized protein n=1 Tax=Guyanagaster necrorhizus TaxID=856835 RepID=A0A9P7W1N8_9AGAR|nr:uncharacterized protein BT62DRAFT_1001182 [Guyanagaster necrorhizus MCA 3950]KAG7450344.1 hypothetical protein BT62DRAFT_1001182 [Guyanagaster necrorhizus MCA 3950]
MAFVTSGPCNGPMQDIWTNACVPHGDLTLMRTSSLGGVLRQGALICLVSASVLSFGESRKTEKKKSHFILWFAPPRHQITYGTPYIWDSPHLYCSGYNIIRPWSVASSSEFQLPPTYRDAVVELTRHEHLEWKMDLTVDRASKHKISHWDEASNCKEKSPKRRNNKFKAWVVVNVNIQGDLAPWGGPCGNCTALIFMYIVFETVQRQESQQPAFLFAGLDNAYEFQRCVLRAEAQKDALVGAKRNPRTGLRSDLNDRGNKVACFPDSVISFTRLITLITRASRRSTSLRISKEFTDTSLEYLSIRNLGLATGAAPTRDVARMI